MDNNIKQKFITKIILILILPAITLLFYGCSFDNIENILICNSNLSQEEKDYYAHTNTWSNNRSDYDSDSIFANFRAVNCGKLKNNYIFRGASPYLNNERTPYVNNFLEKYDIKNVISLSESNDKITEYTSNPEVSSYFFSTCLKNNEIQDKGLGLDSINIKDQNCMKQIIGTFNEIAKSTGNIYIHCQIGRDRTGIYCILVEALADASYEEIVEDYMTSFKNYSFIDEINYNEEYNEIKNSYVDSVLCLLTKTSNPANLNNLDLKKATEDLLYSNGMPYKQIKAFENKISS